jgi:hypothetical protein
MPLFQILLIFKKSIHVKQKHQSRLSWSSIELRLKFRENDAAYGGFSSGSAITEEDFLSNFVRVLNLA